MNTQTALEQLGATADTLTQEQREAFDRDGYFVLFDVFTPAECKEMGAEFDRLEAEDGANAGMEVSLEGEDGRLYNPQEARRRA
jgi:hypothetical protein